MEGNRRFMFEVHYCSERYLTLNQCSQSLEQDGCCKQNGWNRFYVVRRRCSAGNVFFFWETCLEVISLLIMGKNILILMDLL